MGEQKRPKRRGGMNVFTSCISTTLVLLLLGTAVFFVTVARNVSTSIRENFTVSLLLDDDVKPAHVEQLKKQLLQLPCAREVTYISKEQAWQVQSKALGTDSTDFLGENPMPASFEVHLKADYAHTDSLRLVVPELKKDAAVLEVSYPENLMESLNDNIRRISTIMLVVAVLLMFVSFELINNTIRLSIHARRFLIHTMNLVGASWGFIRRPFLAKAFWIGFGSALVASGLGLAGIHALAEYEPHMRELITWDVWTATFGTVFICGILLTLTCAYFSVNKYLRSSYDKLHRY